MSAPGMPTTSRKSLKRSRCEEKVEIKKRRPKFAINFQKYMDILSGSTKTVSILSKVITLQMGNHEGLFVTVQIHRREGKILCGIYKLFDENSSRMIQFDQQVDTGCLEDYTKIINNIMFFVYDCKMCPCGKKMAKPDEPFCTSCDFFMGSRMHFEDLDCIICQENNDNVRKLCKCGQYVCLSCYVQYDKDICPHCRQKYTSFNAEKVAQNEEEDDEETEDELP